MLKILYRRFYGGSISIYFFCSAGQINQSVHYVEIYSLAIYSATPMPLFSAACCMDV